MTVRPYSVQLISMTEVCLVQGTLRYSFFPNLFCSWLLFQILQDSERYQNYINKLLTFQIGVVIEDKEMVNSSMGGRPWKAGKFAFSLRTSLWSEHLGLRAGEVGSINLEFSFS